MKVPLVHHSGLVMALGGFTLADRLGAKTMPCRVAGCTRTWLQFGGKAAFTLGGRSETVSGSAGAGMCDPCKKKLASITDKQRRCDVPGCDGTWTWTVDAQLEAFATHRPPPKNLCASCEGKLAALEEKQVACTVPGCERTATLSKRSQLLAQAQAEKAQESAQEAAHDEAQAQAEKQAEHAAAHAHAHAHTPSEAAAEAAPADETQTGAESAGDDSAEGATAEAAPAEKTSSDKNGDREVAARAEKPGRVTYEGPFCEPCGDVARRLQDRPVTCGINGCKRKWIWKADDQLQAFAAGKPNEPPRRMCDTCRAHFGKLSDREVRCRTSGCKKTWTWSRFDQLDACAADKAAPKAPARMCDNCYDLFQKLKDVERPCRKSGCKRTWTDKRGAQLARLVRGKTGDPYPQYCNECRKELGDLEDREISCKTEGCPGTWTWSREQQLAAGVRPSPKPVSEPASEPAGESRKTAPAPAEAAAAPPAPTEAAVAAGSEVGDPGTETPAETTTEAATETAAEAATEAAKTSAPTAEAAPVPTGSAVAAPAHRHAHPGRRDKKHRRQRQIQPPERLCHACAEFLKDRKTLETPCSQCGTAIYWPPESQLQTHLGNWATPSLCGACKRDATEAARRVAKEVLRQQVMDAAPHPAAETAEAEAPAAPEPTADDLPPENQPS